MQRLLQPRTDSRRGLVAALALLCAAQACAGATRAPDDYAFGAGSLNLDPWAPRPHVETPVPRPVKAAQPSPQPQKPEAAHEVVSAAPPRPVHPAGPPPPRVVGSPVLEAPQQPIEPVHPPVVAKPAQVQEKPLIGTTRTEADLRGVQRVEAASALLGTPGLQDSAFVAHVLRASGQELDVDRSRPYAPALYDQLRRKGRILTDGPVAPGDLIFFNNTADLNSNGRPDDGVTLVGVVERVDGARIVLIAQRAGKVRRLAVDPSRPELVRDARGEVVNTRLVRWPGAQGPLTAAQCLAGFARP